MSGFPSGERHPEVVAADVLERITDGFVALDARGRFCYVNRSAERMLQRDRSALLGRTIEQAFPAVARSPAFARYRRAVEDGKPLYLEESLPDPGRCFEVRLYPSASGVSIHFRDVTEQQAEESDRQRQLQSEHEGRLRAEREAVLREEMMRILSHDLRNPINVIRLSAEFALDPVIADAAAREDALTRIVHAATRMERLIQGLLDASRLGAGKSLPVELAPLDLAPVIREGCALFEPQVRQKRIRLQVSVQEGCPLVSADEDRVLQVLWNLIGNAVKFTPDEGTVVVGAERCGAYVCVSVRDSGPGVSREDQARLFDAYWQEKRTARLGTGLGLPTTKAIVEAHRGRIWVASELGRGTTFTFALPLALP